MSSSLQAHGLEATRLLPPWDFPGKNPVVGNHFILQGIFLTHGSNQGLLHCRQIFYHLSHQGRCLEEINLNIHWKDWYLSWAPKISPPDAKGWLFGKDSDDRKDWGQEEKGAKRIRYLDCIPDLMDLRLSKLQEIVEDKGAWLAAVHGIAKSGTWLSKWTTIIIVPFGKKLFSRIYWINRMSVL